ncbi:hypothetical protein O3P69_019725 [Scylla paramamosain]|uniref:Uncharacterized protein n=1 Tax=Scylla paramamosain TaxID=85552 RepID=A0AAW0SYU8_SCYPA
MRNLGRRLRNLARPCATLPVILFIFTNFFFFFFFLAADGFTYTFGIYFVQLVQYYDATAAATSWIASILVGVTLGSGPIAGILVNKFGCRVVTIAGALLASAALFSSIAAPSVETLYVTIGLGAGLGFGLIYLPAIVCVTCYFEKRRSFATGIAVCGSGIGTFAFSPLVEYLINEVSWQNSLIVISGIMLNCVVFGALFRPLEVDAAPPPPPTPDEGLQMRPPTLLEPSNPATPDPCAPATPTGEMMPQVIINPDTLPLPPLSVKRLSLDRLRKNFSDINLRGSGGGASHLPRRLLHHHNNSIPRVGSAGAIDPLDPLIKTAVSQPLLPSPGGGAPAAQGGGSLPPSHHGSGLLYRKDIFYRGSLLNIPSYRQDPGSYRASMVRLPDEETPSEAEKAKVCGCVPCSRETRDAITSLMDWGLLTDGIFILFAISNFCTSIGFNAPYVFVVDRARHLGIPDSQSSFLLAVVGISNTISRIVLGYISDQPWVNRLYLYNVALTLCGLGTCGSIWFTSYSSQIFYAAVFGATSGAYVGLTSVVLVDLLGMERLTNAFGLLLLFQGIASLIGPPICASLFDMTLSYDYTFLLAGGMIAVSGLMLFFIPCIWRAQARGREARATLFYKVTVSNITAPDCGSSPGEGRAASQPQTTSWRQSLSDTTVHRYAVSDTQGDFLSTRRGEALLTTAWWRRGVAATDAYLATRLDTAWWWRGVAATNDTTYLPPLSRAGVKFHNKLYVALNQHNKMFILPDVQRRWLCRRSGAGEATGQKAEAGCRAHAPVSLRCTRCSGCVAAFLSRMGCLHHKTSGGCAGSLHLSHTLMPAADSPRSATQGQQTGRALSSYSSMVHSCCAMGCPNRQGDKGVSFHRFPADPEQRERWLTATRKKGWRPTSASRLCGAHFVRAASPLGLPPSPPHTAQSGTQELRVHHH